MYENAKFEDEDIYEEYETIEDIDESSQDFKRNEDGNAASGSNDAVSFLAGILKPKSDEASKTIEIKKINPKKEKIDAGLNDPNRKHVCNVCSKKFQKRSNLIDHLRLHANVKVYACEVSLFA
jgi:uncharacterized Zn-finger protein